MGLRQIIKSKTRVKFHEAADRPVQQRRRKQNSTLHGMSFFMRVIKNLRTFSETGQK